MAGNKEVLDQDLKCCSKCKLSLPVAEFCRNKKTSSGLNYACRTCNKLYYVSNKAKVLANSSTYYTLNRDKIIKRQVAYQKKHAEHRLKYMRAWRAKNLQACRAYENAWQKHKRKTDPVYKLKRNMSTSIYQSLVKGKGKNKSSWQELVGYTVEDLRQHLSSKFQEGMSWSNYGKWHIDHIIPLDFFKVSDPGDPKFKVAWGLENLQPLWAVDNMKKSNKLEGMY